MRVRINHAGRTHPLPHARADSDRHIPSREPDRTNRPQPSSSSTDTNHGDDLRQPAHERNTNTRLVMIPIPELPILVANLHCIVPLNGSNGSSFLKKPTVSNFQYLQFHDDDAASQTAVTRIKIGTRLGIAPMLNAQLHPRSRSLFVIAQAVDSYRHRRVARFSDYPTYPLYVCMFSVIISI